VRDRATHSTCDDGSMVAPPTVEPRPAATVVLVRSGPVGLEVLLTHRPSTMAFAADMHVFPGGRVDHEDASLGADPARIAAIREAFEEVGVLLGAAPRGADLVSARAALLAGATSFAEIVRELDLVLDLDALIPWSRWVTPATMSRRFDARFFVAPMPDGAEATLASDEVVGHGWHTPRAALDAMADGRLGMWLPTSTTLQQLEHATSVEGIAAVAADPEPGAIDVEVIDEDVTRLTMPSGGGVAGQPVHAYLVGRRAVVLVDPGDPTGPALERAIDHAARRRGHIVAVALTHLDPDHAAGAEALAEQLDVPVLASPARARDLPYDVVALSDDGRIDVGDVPLRVIATPGPTPDHLAFVVGDGGLVITGDLDGTRGAKAILAPTDTAAWDASRVRLRADVPAARWLGGHPTD
jgi:glyoxylase-like metal-dependent hydrolase (beta-lactamase superfamily II)/8-oxo-dGTP pyrophosphatase MutT (NUDIX family)